MQQQVRVSARVPSEGARIVSQDHADDILRRVLSISRAVLRLEQEGARLGNCCFLTPAAKVHGVHAADSRDVRWLAPVGDAIKQGPGMANLVYSYPWLQVDGPFLWVWPESGLEALAESSKVVGNMHPSVAIPGFVEGEWEFMGTAYIRDVPLRYDTLMENVVDPSHVPFSHHG